MNSCIITYLHYREDDSYRIQLQDEKDEFYTLPKSLLEGCGCQKTCSKACSCLKKESRMKKCARITCKKCNCFKREKSGEAENLQLSDQCQCYIDQMSSEEESLDDLSSTESEGELSEIEDFDF